MSILLAAVFEAYHTISIIFLKIPSLFVHQTIVAVGILIGPYRHAALLARCPGLQNANRECLPGSAECLKALTLVRGGGTDNEPSVWTLFLRVFMTKFGRESDAKEGELDLEGGGLMRRLGRFVSRVLAGSKGSPKSAGSKGTRRG